MLTVNLFVCLYILLAYSPTSYWSPTIHYFHNDHRYYVIVAIMFELVIGFEYPSWPVITTSTLYVSTVLGHALIDQLATGSLHTIWYVAKWYSVDLLSEFLLGFWILKVDYSFAMLIIIVMEAACSVMVVHIMVLALRVRSLDSVILLSLLLLYIINSWYQPINTALNELIILQRNTTIYWKQSLQNLCQWCSDALWRYIQSWMLSPFSILSTLASTC